MCNKNKRLDTRSDEQRDERVQGGAHGTDGDTSIRLFMSYGRRDAGDLAERLKKDLETRYGFEVWMDTRRVRSGRDWQRQIEDGLRSTQVVLALLSPHAVRRRGIGDAEDDSVCLDELSFARFAKPPTPIVPVMGNPCEPPFCIFRLDYVDLCDWRESEKVYEAGLERIVEAVEEAKRGKKRYRFWDQKLKPWDFTVLLHEKRRGFTGRRWLLDEIERWRKKSLGERALLISGDPGVGKTAIVAELVHGNPKGQVLAYHCCQADTPETLEPWRFVRSIAAMIASRLTEYAQQLQQDEKVWGALEEGACREQPASGLEQGILAPLERISAPEDGPRYILVDALDEALLSDSALNIVQLLASRLERFPGWLRVVATSRRDPVVRNALRGLRAKEIEAQDARNLSDLREYLGLRLTERKLKKKREAAAVGQQVVEEALVTKSKGNFLFAVQALEGLRRGIYGFDELEKLPPGLFGLYQIFFERHFPDKNSFVDARKVLEVLVVARDSLNLRQIARATGLDEDYELPEVMHPLRTYLREIQVNGSKQYSLFHKSFCDWLTNRDLQGTRFFVSERKGHQRLAESMKGQWKRDSYAMRHLPSHLRALKRWDELAAILTDFTYLEARNEAGQMFEVGLEMQAAWQSMPDEHTWQRNLRLLHQALRRYINWIHRHHEDYPQALFQCMWNEAWWYDCAEAAKHYDPPQGGWGPDGPPWTRPEPKLSTLLEKWRNARPKDPWMRNVRPPSYPVGGQDLLCFRGHEGPVDSVAFADNGKFVLSSSSVDGTVRVWNALSGKEIFCISVPNVTSIVVPRSLDKGIISLSSHDHSSQRLEYHNVHSKTKIWQAMHDELVGCHVALSHNGSYLYVSDGRSGEDYLFHVSLDSGFFSDVKIISYRGAVITSSFSPNENLLAVAYSSNNIAVWETLTGSRRVLVEDFDNSITGIAVSTDGERIIAATVDGKIHVLEGNTGEKLFWVRGQKGHIKTLKFFPDNDRFLSGGHDNTIRVWNSDVEKKEELCFYGHHDVVENLACTQDGSKIVSGSRDHTVRVWDLKQRKMHPLLKGHSERITNIELFSDGLRAATGSEDERLFIWSLNSGEILSELKGQKGPVELMVLDDDQSHIAALSAQEVLVWNTHTSELAGRLHEIDNSLNCLTYTPDGNYIITSSISGMRIWDANRFNKIRCVFPLSERTSVKCLPDKKRVLCIWNDGSSSKYDLSSGKRLDESFLHIDSGSVFWDVSQKKEKDYEFIAISLPDRTIQIWEIFRGIKKTQFNKHRSRISCLAFSPDGKFVVSGSIDGSLYVWEASWMLSGKSARIKGHLIGHRDGVNCVEFDSEGKFIVSGGNDGKIIFWDSSTMKKFYEFSNRRKPVYDLTLSEDTTLVAAGKNDGTISIWEIWSKRKFTLKGHSKAVKCVSFIFNGEKLISGSEDQTIRVWNTEKRKEEDCYRGDCGIPVNVDTCREGKRIISSWTNGMVLVWDWCKHRSIYNIYENENPWKILAFSNDGKMMLSVRRIECTSDAELFVWQIGKGKQLGRLRVRNDIESASFVEKDCRAILRNVNGELSIWDWKRKTCEKKEIDVSKDKEEVNNNVLKIRKVRNEVEVISHGKVSGRYPIVVDKGQIFIYRKGFLYTRKDGQFGIVKGENVHN
jgi:WD40 repeat protein